MFYLLVDTFKAINFSSLNFYYVGREPFFSKFVFMLFANAWFPYRLSVL